MDQDGGFPFRYFECVESIDRRTAVACSEGLEARREDSAGDMNLGVLFKCM